ncbi:MAG TPA: 4-(cytidine 5'-diphospho)-2-C-methyl-D-erythritol kinase [Burkholderiales bacterium]|nr:4-(cytidine 5'-diphospho)-2-C-methyl-D-erythritol kinase [Burkholderiales bacterium]
MSGAVHSYPAPAKLNLMLRIVGRRPDGYHLLQTVFRFIDYGDTVTITVRDDGHITRSRNISGVPPETDLTVRAARALQQATGCALGADIAVEKRIPMGAGLGGGSSDAATVLLALNRLWNTGLNREALSALGLTLGADVPVFVFGRNAFAEGIGERLSAIELPESWYVVLTPRVAVPTARVFAHPDLKRDSEPIRIQRFSAGPGGNDLQPVVCSEYPEVARHLAWLEQQAPAMMTGSGSSVFAAFGSERAARAVLARLPADMNGFAAAGLDRHPLQHLAD